MQPDLFIYLGDNIYADTEDMDVMQAKYDQLGSKPEFQALQQSCTVLATWDDHDYGVNDGGLEYPMKEASKKLFLQFWGESIDSDRWRHPGIYTSHTYNEAGKRVQIILLDTRTFRTPLKPNDGSGRNDYLPNHSKKATLLGAAQWQWLEEQLKIPSEVRIIASSTQFGISYNGYEAWANFPLEKKKMFRLIQKTKANGVIFISGDVHYGELSCSRIEGLYPIYDVTSSGITQEWPHVEKNLNRLGTACRDNNFGYIAIDWNKPDPEIFLRVYDINGKARINKALTLHDLH